MEGVSRATPLMVTVGNHESACHSEFCLAHANYSEALRNFSAYNTRWHMPSPESNGTLNMWYRCVRRAVQQRDAEHLYRASLRQRGVGTTTTVHLASSPSRHQLGYWRRAHRVHQHGDGFPGRERVRRLRPATGWRFRAGGRIPAVARSRLEGGRGDGRVDHRGRAQDVRQVRAANVRERALSRHVTHHYAFTGSDAPASSIPRLFLQL